MICVKADAISAMPMAGRFAGRGKRKKPPPGRLLALGRMGLPMRYPGTISLSSSV